MGVRKACQRSLIGFVGTCHSATHNSREWLKSPALRAMRVRPRLVASAIKIKVGTKLPTDQAADFAKARRGLSSGKPGQTGGRL